MRKPVACKHAQPTAPTVRNLDREDQGTWQQHRKWCPDEQLGIESSTYLGCISIFNDWQQGMSSLVIGPMYFLHTMKIRWGGIFLYWIVFPLRLIFCDFQIMPEVLWQQLNQVGCMHQKLLAKQNLKTFLLVDLLKNGSAFKNSKIKNNNNKKRELQINVPFFFCVWKKSLT